jgi:hypothetical protein
LDTVNFEDVCEALQGERAYQDSLASTSETDGHHTVTEFLLYMDTYVQDAKQLASKTWGPQATTKTLDAIRKITALGIACMQQNGVVHRHMLHKPTGQRFGLFALVNGVFISMDADEFLATECEPVR